MGALRRQDPVPRVTAGKTQEKPKKPKTSKRGDSSRPARRRVPGRRATTARANGRKGGRPRKPRSFEDFASVPDPPEHPLELGYWIQRIIAIDAERIQAGRGDKELSTGLRAYARSMALIMPAAIMMAALEPDGPWRQGLDGDMPEHPFAVAYRFLLRLAIGANGLIQGEPDPYGAEIRASASTYAKIIPPDVLYEAQRKLNEERADFDAGGPPMVPAPIPAAYAPLSARRPQ